MSNEEIVNNLIKIITGKDLHITKIKNPFFQSKSDIYCNHWAEGLHELAHWLSCEPKSRHLVNLGLPETKVEFEHPLHYRMMYEECVATVLTKLLYDKFCTKDAKVDKYMDYMYNQSINIGILEKIDYIKAKNEAIQIITNIYLFI
jgi:hypothetical protein